MAFNILRLWMLQIIGIPELLKPLTHRFNTVSGRYIRLTVLSSNEGNRAFVREFEVYEEVKNLAVGQFCTQRKEVLETITNGSSFGWRLYRGRARRSSHY